MKRARGSPVIPKIYAQTFVEMNKIAPKDSRLWQWWDYGYACQYYSGRMSFCDGGLNFGDWVYPLAIIHSTHSPMQASQLMKYITWHQKEIFERIGAISLDSSKWNYYFKYNKKQLKNLKKNYCLIN